MKRKLIFQTILTVFLLGITTLTFNSCYSDYGMSASDYDVAVTFRNKNVNFQNYSTFAMPDSIVRVGSQSGTPNTTYDKLILNQVVSQMETYGYTRVTAGPNVIPDVVVLVNITSSDNYVYDPGYFWGSWGWWGGWGYNPGYGPGWGYYPPYYGGTVYSFTTGSIIVTMLDAKSNDPNKQEITAAWAGTLNGYAESSSTLPSRITNGINELFQQSPYLKVN